MAHLEVAAKDDGNVLLEARHEAHCIELGVALANFLDGQCRLRLCGEVFVHLLPRAQCPVAPGRTVQCAL